MPASMYSQWIYKATGVRRSPRSWTSPAPPRGTIRRSTEFRILSGCLARLAIRIHSVASRPIGTRSTPSWNSYVRFHRALKVNLVDWSRGGMRVIGYAALRAHNVDKVVVLAPTRFPPAAGVPTYPMNMTDKRDVFIDWDRQIDSRNCPQQIDPSSSSTRNSTRFCSKLPRSGSDLARTKGVRRGRFATNTKAVLHRLRLCAVRPLTVTEALR